MTKVTGAEVDVPVLTGGIISSVQHPVSSRLYPKVRVILTLERSEGEESAIVPATNEPRILRRASSR